MGRSAIMGNKCVINSCQDSRRNNKNIRFFRFPKDQCKLNAWISACKINVSSDNYRNLRICGKHFETKCIGKKRLKKNALPRLNLGVDLVTSTINENIYDFPEQESDPDDTYKPFKGDEGGGIILDENMSQNTELDYEVLSIVSETTFEDDDEKSVEIPVQTSLYPDLDFKLLSENTNCYQCVKKPVGIEMVDYCRNCLKRDKTEKIYQKMLKEKDKKIKYVNNINKSCLNRISKLRLQLRNERMKNTLLRKKNYVTLEEKINKMEHISPYSKLFCNMLLKKKRTYTPDEKNISQSISLRSGRTYRFLRTTLGMKLPCKASLNNWTPIKYLKPGVNKVIVKTLADFNKTLDKNSKKCTLLFDDMAIKRALTYNSNRDQIEGFVDSGFGRKKVLAKQMCVFMLRGTCGKVEYKKVIGYASSKNGLKSKELAKLIRFYIKLAQKLGFEVLATVCDQGPSNRAAYSKLNVSVKSPYFYVGNKKIYALYDVPHLIKSFRNVLINNENIQTPDGKACWYILKRMFDIDRANVTRMCPKIKTCHIYPDHFDKMRVSLATQIFSHTCSSAIMTLIAAKKFSGVEDDANNTALFLSKINNLFDCLNSKKLKDKNPYRRGLKPNNHIYKFLKEMIPYFIYLAENNSKKIYCFKGMVQNLKAIISLTNDMCENKTNQQIFFLLTGKFNQDPLENFFSLVRSRIPNNSQPTSTEFNSIIANLTTINLINYYSNKSNCESDGIEEKNENKIGTSEVYENIEIEESDNEMLENDEEDDDNCEYDIPLERSSKNIIEINSMKYVSGYAIFKLLNKIKCDNCVETMTKDDKNLELNSEWFIFYKNYSKEKFYLKMPSDLFFRVCQSNIDTFYKNFKLHCLKSNIKKKIDRIMY